MIQIKILEADTLAELMDNSNDFLLHLDERDIVDIKYQSSMSFTAEEELKSYSVLIIYGMRKLPITRGK